MKLKKKLEKEKEVDHYPKIDEEKFHNFEKMISLEVLSKEKEICSLIIQYKKKNGLSEEI